MFFSLVYIMGKRKYRRQWEKSQFGGASGASDVDMAKYYAGYRRERGRWWGFRALKPPPCVGGGWSRKKCHEKRGLISSCTGGVERNLLIYLNNGCDWKKTAAAMAAAARLAAEQKKREDRKNAEEAAKAARAEEVAAYKAKKAADKAAKESAARQAELEKSVGRHPKGISTLAELEQVKEKMTSTEAQRRKEVTQKTPQGPIRRGGLEVAGGGGFRRRRKSRRRRGGKRRSRRRKSRQRGGKRSKRRRSRRRKSRRR